MPLKKFQLNCFKWNENDKILTILVKGGFLGQEHDILSLNMVSVFRSSLINKVENPTILKRETEREILIELAIIDTCSKHLQGDISREFLSWSILELVR